MEKLRNNKNFKPQEFLNAPYLTEEYIKENGWYPVPDKWFSGEAPKNLVYSPFFNQDDKGKIYKITEFGEIPCRGRSEFREGDILIMQDYKGSDISEKFIKLEKRHLDAYEKGKWDLLPDAVVVHEPTKES